MKCLLFVILAGCAVKCDDNNYYVIEMPEDRLEDQERSFSVYWNVPTMQCKSKKIPFQSLYERYGILQNANDSFRGEEISILYDPGLFPALLKNETSGKFKFRNGGVPQEGNLELHLETFKSVLEQSIPDANFRGVGIIDFESWRPIFRQNFGVLVPYKDISIEIEKKLHWWWPKQWIQAEAKQRFEDAAREFMQTTVSIAKQMRPNALWGYYGFPYCFNMANNKMRESCADKVPEENDRTHWLWSESTALYPSVYSSRELTSTQLAGLIRGRMKEAERVRWKNTPVLPYFWFRYRDGGYFNEEDLKTALETLYKSNASGFIIWGSSNDVNTVSKCTKLKHYLENTLGPAIAAYTRPSTKIRDEMTHIPGERITTRKPELLTNITDPEFDWVPPENYTQDIENYVEAEIKRKGSHYNKINQTVPNINDSLLMEIILNTLMEEHNMTKNEKKGLPFIDIARDKQSHDRDTSQPVDVNTGIVQSKNDTNVFLSTESLPTELLDNSQTETINSSPENLVTKFLQSKQNAQDIVSTNKASTNFPLILETSQTTNSDFLISKLQRHHLTTHISKETTESNDLKDETKSLSTEYMTPQDNSKNIELISNPSSTEFKSYDEKHISTTSSIDFSTTELQKKYSSILPTGGTSTESTNNFKEYSEVYNSHSTEDLVAKFVTKGINNIEISTTESTHSSEEPSDKIFSEEYLITKLPQSNQNEIFDSTTESASDNLKQKETFTKEYYNNKQRGNSETTTSRNLRIPDSTEKTEVENLYLESLEETDKLETIETSDADVMQTIQDEYTNIDTDTQSGSEINTITQNDTENTQFFNQDTFLDNLEGSEVAISISNSTYTFDNRNDATESNNFDTKEGSESTASPTTELDQVNVYVL